MEYNCIRKGKGNVYEHDGKLYVRVKTNGNIKYLKCSIAGCDCSAKLIGDKDARIELQCWVCVCREQADAGQLVSFAEIESSVYTNVGDWHYLLSQLLHRPVMNPT